VTGFVAWREYRNVGKTCQTGRWLEDLLSETYKSIFLRSPWHVFPLVTLALSRFSEGCEKCPFGVRFTSKCVGRKVHLTKAGPGRRQHRVPPGQKPLRMGAPLVFVLPAKGCATRLEPTWKDWFAPLE
jgi:hypothetical protein